MMGENPSLQESPHTSRSN